MISRAQEPKQLYAEGGITSVRQPYFLGKVVKKIGKGLKKVVKSPIGKAALIGGGLWGLNKWGPLAGKISPMFSSAGKWAMGNKGKAALLGLGAAGMALPFMADEEEEIIETPWETTPDSIANIRDMARRQDSSLAFLPSSIYAQPGYYNMAEGGVAQLANGGGVAEAQAEQMLKMEYQKYRNQGGTMSYQQFKMQVLKQAQQRGPMAEAQPQMMNKGGRSGYKLGELVEDQESMFMTPQGDEVVTNQMEEIEGQTAGPDWFQERLNILMDLGYEYELAAEIARNTPEYFKILGEVGGMAQGGRVGLLGGGPVPGSHVAGYTTPAGYNKYDYRTGGVRVAAANGGIMPLLDLGGKEKDYRQDGGFVGIGRKEKADDVPARLSKNEFVFTADAVRNAGGGDIDAGAEVMDNMMKHLESGGEISEESQGLGGEEMISEEEMIEAPDGAQEMYEQQAMLQSRMA